MRRAIAALAALTVLTSGCAREPEAAAAPDNSVAAPENDAARPAGDVETRGPVVSRGVPALVTVEVDGAVDLSWEEEIDDLRIVTAFDVPDRSLRLLSVGLLDLIALGDGQLFRGAFDLVGSSYIGDGGSFEIPATVAASEAADATSVVSALSNAFLMLVELENPAGEITQENIAEVREFRTALEPCSIKVEANERSGSLDCPALADGGGETVRLLLRWELADRPSAP